MFRFLSTVPPFCFRVTPLFVFLDFLVDLSLISRERGRVEERRFRDILWNLILDFLVANRFSTPGLLTIYYKIKREGISAALAFTKVAIGFRVMWALKKRR